MATSLLRIGRLGSLKALQLESWGGVLRWPAAALCTKGGEPPANPGKAQSKIDAPDERATLLAYKTAVAFPVRLAPAGFPPAHLLGEPHPEAIPVGQTAVAAAAVEASPAGHVETIIQTPPPVAEAAPPVYTEPALQAAVETPPSLPEAVVTETPVVAKTTDDVAPAADPNPNPDERASLLAYKSAVAFPVRLASAGFPPAHLLGEPQPEVTPVGQTAVAAAAAATLAPPATAAIEAPLAKELLEEASPVGHVDPITVAEAAPHVITDPAPEVAVETPPSLTEAAVTETPVVAKTTDDVTPAAATSSPPKEPSADGSSSSSSSSSDSDSDSDSDSEDSEEGVKTKTKEASATAPSAGEVGVSQDAVAPGDNMKTGDIEPETAAFETIPVDSPPTSATQATEEAEVSVDTDVAAVSSEASEELVDSAPQISSAAEESVADAAPQVQEHAAELASDPQPTPDKPIETSPPPSSSSSLETPSEGPVVVLEAAAEAHVEPEPRAPLEAAEALPEAPLVEAVAEAPLEAEPVAEESPESVSVAPAEVASEAPAEVASEAPVEGAEELVDTAPVLTEAAGEELQAVEVTHAEEAPSAVEAAAPAAEESPKSVSDVAPAELAPEAAVEAAAPVGGSDELVDPAPVLTEAAGEELQAESPAEPEAVEAAEEAAAAPEPEEPFDNSTYKNCQHHNYNTFTFVDLDLEMAKHRLPQPSSGRPSPLH
ncbi:unnamed protein product [Boreogadus saida]